MVDTGGFFDLLKSWVAVDTTIPAVVVDSAVQSGKMRTYFTQSIIPYLDPMGFSTRVVENPVAPEAPFLIARGVEGNHLPTILIYGHADTVPAMEGAWDSGLSPLTLTRKGRQWFGRGTADNKGQHGINLAALNAVIQVRGTLGFNVTVLMESGEEAGSPGLHAICKQEQAALTAHALVASDGPRVAPDLPTIFGGSRAVFNFDLTLCLRQGSHHSGNWGGLLANPGIILSHAIACLVDARGRILVDALRPGPLPKPIAQALDRLPRVGQGGPEIDPDWGEPGLGAARKLYGWNTLEVLALSCGNPDHPVNAIPPQARARCHIRFTAASDPDTFIPAIRAHLDAHGFSQVQIQEIPNNYGRATWMLPDNPWVCFATDSFEKTLGTCPVFLPCLGGTLPNDAFGHLLGMPTVWVPHSYGGCCQHAPNEHLLEPVVRQGLAMMAGLFWDLGEEGGRRCFWCQND
jgi:acetylornithine deacetylase/succinyl-diaminopimelate desuccinylase-like protein